MKQKFIFKKQLILIAIILLLLLIYKIEFNKLNVFLILYLFHITTITFLPKIRKKISYPRIVHSILFYVPLLISIFFIDNKLLFKNSLLSYIIAIGLCTILACIVNKFNKESFTLKKEIIIYNINVAYITKESFDLFLVVIAEEIFFRGYIILELSKKFGILSVIISSLLFVLTHYVNRWANIMFTLKSYVFQFILSIILGCIMYYMNALIPCVLGHIIFNYSQIIHLISSYRKKSNNSECFFTDY